jgi:hypothetical protein
MDIARKLNRDYYKSMREKGYTHDQLIAAVFPPERKEKFESDVEEIKELDYSGKEKTKKNKKNAD